MEKIIAPENLRSLLRYDPEVGNLYWIERPSDMFETIRDKNAWNTRYAGKEAFATKHSRGYKQGTINGVTVLAHRVVWAFLYGEWPSEQIDHINGKRDDNRSENLRVVSQEGNSRNAKRFCTNTSGVTGFVKSSRASAHSRVIGVWERS